MDYARVYGRLIAHFQQAVTDGAIERHHIVPRALGGDNSRQNIVALTPKAHFIAHRLLAKMHGGPMWAALAYMTRAGVKSAGNVHITARTYDFVKRQDAAWRSIRYTEKNHYRGKTHSPEVREKMRGPRPSIAGENHPRFGKSLAETNELIAFVRKPRDLVLDLTVRDRINALIVDKPKELRALIERYRRSAAMSEAAKARDSNGAANPNFGNGQAIAGERNPMFGKAHADSTKAKIGAKAKRRVTCPHCGKGGNIANMARWHFGNCRDPRNPALAAPVRADSGH